METADAGLIKRQDLIVIGGRVGGLVVTSVAAVLHIPDLSSM